MKIKTTFAMLAFALGLQPGLAAAEGAAAVEPLQPIAALDVQRYMGTWYEIAKYPNWFQKKCVGDTRADYSLQPTGQIQVINRCREEDGACPRRSVRRASSGRPTRRGSRSASRPPGCPSCRWCGVTTG